MRGLDLVLGIAFCALAFCIVGVVAWAVDWVFRQINGPDIFGPRKRRGGR